LYVTIEIVCTNIHDISDYNWHCIGATVANTIAAVIAQSGAVLSL